MMCRPGLRACSSSRSIAGRAPVPCWSERSKIKRDSETFRDFTFTRRTPWTSTRGSAGSYGIAPTGRASIRRSWSAISKASRLYLHHDLAGGHLLAFGDVDCGDDAVDAGLVD